MNARLITSNSIFEHQASYSRAVVSGSWVFVSGCTGYDYKTHTISPSVVEQTEQCMVNIAEALSAGGATVADIVRVRYIVVDRKEFPQCFGVLRKWFGEMGVLPAATMIEAGLFGEEMKVEIEVTARVREKAGEESKRGGEGFVE